jgi:glutaredoxin-related protein
MKKFKCSIEGKTPYMQHRMDDQKLEDWEKNRKLIIERDDVAKEDQIRAEFHSYQDKDGFFIPTEHLKGCLIGGGALVKSKVGNSKKSMKNIVAGMFFIEETKLRLPKDYIIDKRSAVNRNVKARVICIRPKWDEWKADFTLLIDNDTITKETVKEIIEQAGNFIGIGSFRPTNNGSFGRFSLKSIKEIV